MTEDNSPYSGDDQGGDIDADLLAFDQESPQVADTPIEVSLAGHSAGTPHEENALAAGSDPGGIVVARGTGDGLVIRLDGRVQKDVLCKALKDYVDSRKSFLQGNSVALEWIGIKPEQSIVEEVLALLTQEFDIQVRINRLRSVERNQAKPVAKRPEVPAKEVEMKRTGKSVSLFDGIEAIGLNSSGLNPANFGSSYSGAAESVDQAALGGESSSVMWDDPDARMIYSTLRSGQRVETEHSLIVMGDVNSGAEVVAGGDIIVLGALRGVAHAGAYDETGGGRVIVALNMAPTQLRIGTVISRGSTEGQKTAEIARVDGAAILVEPYQSRNVRGHLFRANMRG